MIWEDLLIGERSARECGRGSGSVEAGEEEAG